MAAVWLCITAMVFCQVASASNIGAKPGEVVQPEIVIPGEWLTDPSESFLYLPLTIPTEDAIKCKVMTNGESLLVVVTERPEEEPDSNALKKYKLVMEAMKQEAGHDESLLQGKLQTWIDTEDDDEVKVRVQAAMDSLKDVREAKESAGHKSISVTLGMPKTSKKASLLELDTAPHSVALPSVLRGTTQQHHIHHHATRVIKESFAVEIPFPVPTEDIVVVKAQANTLMIAMPLVRKSLEAKGISTGGKPFLRIPVFDSLGKWVTGPKVDLLKVAKGLDIAAVVSQKGLQPLDD